MLYLYNYFRTIIKLWWLQILVWGEYYHLHVTLFIWLTSLAISFASSVLRYPYEDLPSPAPSTGFRGPGLIPSAPAARWPPLCSSLKPAIFGFSRRDQRAAGALRLCLHLGAGFFVLRGCVGSSSDAASLVVAGSGLDLVPPCHQTFFRFCACVPRWWQDTWSGLVYSFVCLFLAFRRWFFSSSHCMHSHVDICIYANLYLIRK